jgi:Cu(I)/Ag(I) efflux system membrane fusion protein/cobalt-zinc-cadmium efflux system membrane fusion protein
MKNYRGAFLAALVCNLALAGVLAAWWWRSGATQDATQPAAQSTGDHSTHPSSSQSSEPMASTAQPSEPSLAPIPLSSPRIQSIGLRIGEVTRKAVRDEIRTTGNVVVDETRLAYVQLRFSGWIRRVFVSSTYEHVQQGQPLFTIYSPDLVATQREYLVARENQEQLAESTVPGVAAGAAALTDATLQRLLQWGVPLSEIERLEGTSSVEEELEIASPVTGHVIEREAVPNKFVEPNTRLYTVADLSTVWVMAQVFQSDLARIRVGDMAAVTVDAYPTQTFSGRVDFIYPEVDVATRTTRVRLVLPNPRLRLTPGMFASISLRMSMGQQLTIPATGVLQAGTRSIVFVDDSSGYLQPREVMLGPRVADEFVVTSGLRAGERIVTSANFLIDSESQLQAALRSFAPPPDATAPGALDSQQFTLDFTSQPSPPRRGNNNFHVRLTDSAGAPVSGAEVGVVFFMPAMPAMGMAEMRTESRLSETGNGNYQGAGSLESGGTWQVTVTARRDGRLIASRQMSVNATGGI